MQLSNLQSNSEGLSVLELIRENFLLKVQGIRRIYAGLGSRNWAVDAPNGSYFVKEFLSYEDAQRGKVSIDVATHCRTRGIASPSVLVNNDNETVTVHEGGGIALFTFIHSNERIDKFSKNYMTLMGDNLAATHLALSSYPYPGKDKTSKWLGTEVVGIVAIVDELLGKIRQLKQRSEFDNISNKLLEDRKSQLQQYANLMEPIKTLSKGVIHGDYGQKNIIVDDAEQIWLIDFADAEVFFPAYELGRAAFPPENFEHPDWLERGLKMIESYASRNVLTRNDLIFCARSWLVQLLQSVYGVKQHYLNPHELQDDLDKFWLRRGKATAILFESLEKVERAIARIV